MTTPTMTRKRIQRPTMTSRRYVRGAMVGLLVVGMFAIAVSPASAGKRGHRRSDGATVLIDGAAGTPVAGGISVWAAEFMTTGTGNTNNHATLAQAQLQASRFDLIASHWAWYQPWVADMKAINPNLRLLAYVNGTFSSSTSSAQYPDSYYARDRNGNKVKANGFGTYLMNPLSDGWRQEVANLCNTRIAASGYDGCFLDVMGTSGVNPTSVSSLPVDPRTGVAWTYKNWLDATTAEAEQVRTALAPRPVIGNGLGFGTSYFDNTAPRERILDGLDGGMAENFARASTSSVTLYKNEVNWKADVDMLVDAAARGSTIVTTTKVWTSSTAAQQDSWHRYSLATFLLGYQQGLTFYSFRTDHLLSSTSAYENTPIGTPTGSYTKAGGVYQRNFTNGRVLVNPLTSSVTVSLGASFRNLDGNVVSSVTLPPHTGQILTLA
jgi:hypothetical protein